jgi:hypothetical protein
MRFLPAAGECGGLSGEQASAQGRRSTANMRAHGAGAAQRRKGRDEQSGAGLERRGGPTSTQKTRRAPWKLLVSPQCNFHRFFMHWGE